MYSVSDRVNTNDFPSLASVVKKAPSKQSSATRSDDIQSVVSMATAVVTSPNAIEQPAVESSVQKVSAVATDQVSNSVNSDDSGFQQPRYNVQKEMKRFRQQQKAQMMIKDDTRMQQSHGQMNQRRRQGRQGVMGMASDTCIRAAPAPDREFFVTYVNKNCGLDQMRQYTSDKSINVRDLKIKEGDDYNSFILTVSASEAPKVRDASIWPQGVFVRKYFPAKK